MISTCHHQFSSYSFSASNDLTEYNGDFGSLRWISKSCFDSTKPFLIIFISKLESAAEHTSAVSSDPGLLADSFAAFVVVASPPAPTCRLFTFNTKNKIKLIGYVRFKRGLQNVANLPSTRSPDPRPYWPSWTMRLPFRCGFVLNIFGIPIGICCRNCVREREFFVLAGCLAVAWRRLAKKKEWKWSINQIRNAVRFLLLAQQ